MEEMCINIPKHFAVEEAGDFREKIYFSIQEGKKHFVLDFSECFFVDSTGLGVLVSAYKKCKELNGELILKNINPDVMRVFKLTRLDSIFNII
ncbi:STAS domain-containing protein [Clostridium brassicae]|uniref:Anti-sigma factor antagonist n=1 Tax=Clostridium brassicae TaxID=2999072 RepID=A0ABT4DAL7_9CLOT|nr:STAS domain-containing protein [Clostridium brassicae]MCY6959351.1 STAS domain-containing protein [Clostridium brassicae]